MDCRVDRFSRVGFFRIEGVLGVGFSEGILGEDVEERVFLRRLGFFCSDYKNFGELVYLFTVIYKRKF